MKQKLPAEVALQVGELALQGYLPEAIAAELGVTAQKVRDTLEASFAEREVVDYDKPRRIRLLNVAFSKAEMLMNRTNDEFRFQALINGINSLCMAKAREEGDAAATQMASFSIKLDISKGDHQHVMEEDPPLSISDGDIVDMNPAGDDS